jgi:tRNA threonylcarbamoyladenosine biosynthesis protein TsaE
MIPSLFYQSDVTQLPQLKALAVHLAGQLAAGDLVLLQGTLGAGKTTFSRYVIQHLTGEDTLTPSPTFALIHPYDTPRGELWHMDLYRLSPEEVPGLGWEDNSTQRMTLLEWPERLLDRPHHALTLLLEVTPTKRSLSFQGNSQWQKRLLPFPQL